MKNCCDSLWTLHLEKNNIFQDFDFTQLEKEKKENIVHQTTSVF